MPNPNGSVNDLVAALKERAKELNCLYEVEELFSRPDTSLSDLLDGVARALPPGFQYPDVCEARIVYGSQFHQTPGFHETPWMLSANVVVQDEAVGKIDVSYTQERPAADEGPFLKEERRLINTVTDRLERRIFYERLKTVFEQNRRTARVSEGLRYSAIVDLLRRTDPKLLARISRKMLYFLSWSGVEDAKRMYQHAHMEPEQGGGDFNRPMQLSSEARQPLSDEVFAIAVKYFGEAEVLKSIQKWIMEDRSNFLMKALEDAGTTLPDIAAAVVRFHHLAPHGMELEPARDKAFRVSLVRRLLSDDPHFIRTARNFLHIEDFYELLFRVIYPSTSHGKLGGKAAGLFLAFRVLQRSSQANELLRKIRTPRTWYVASDTILHFISHNDLDEIVEQKYEDIAQVRQEYPYVVHVFKNSALPPEILKGLSVALDELGEAPLIVRSSSLLEDRGGTSFAGKYKSLFLANQGTKAERLAALADAITEVYASTFSPDAIEYRSEHGMIDFHEEMGILIQEVVGKRVGPYFFPAFAGVIFAKNDFRWSPRISREDGLVRMVPGLGTRAVDRLSDDYPILIAPGQPNLRVNVALEEKIRYSPRKMDVINLSTNTFETVDASKLLREYGDDYPGVRNIVSVLRGDHLEQPTAAFGINFEQDHTVVSFEGLFQHTDFIAQVKALLSVLQSELGVAVDLEFAHDGTDLYLLQCRPQSHSQMTPPPAIPWDISQERILFSANRYVTNGAISNVTHIVYVDPQKYADLTKREDLLAVGEAVGQLNQLLPKRRFLLMGPGRWGSRGDIQLGVHVSYSDINNSAMLIEIARKHKGYMPELSFGTHFFQDLVEASILYLPLYPDESGVHFREDFMKSSRNLLSELLPEFAHLSETLHVIDIREATGGKVLQVLMNGDREEAVALLVEPQKERAVATTPVPVEETVKDRREEDHARWRLHSVERMATMMDAERFGVKGLYIVGSTRNATAGPHSDIDLLVHFDGTETQRAALMAWLEGWSLCLAEMNYLRTGFRSKRGLLDIHLLRDEEMRSRMNAPTDVPRRLSLKS